MRTLTGDHVGTPGLHALSCPPCAVVPDLSTRSIPYAVGCHYAVVSVRSHGIVIAVSHFVVSIESVISIKSLGADLIILVEIIFNPLIIELVLDLVQFLLDWLLVVLVHLRDP